MLKSNYGNLIIKKDTILYHATDEEFTYKSEKKLLYTIFHPSEWVGYDSEYIVRIQLKRDIEVLFFITGFRKHYVLSNQEEKRSPEFLEKLPDKIKDRNISHHLKCLNYWFDIEKVKYTFPGWSVNWEFFPFRYGISTPYWWNAAQKLKHNFQFPG